MIYVIIGQSGSGKTTYVKQIFFNEKNFRRFDKPIKYTITNNNLLIGHYGIGIRCEGSDTLGFNQYRDIMKFVKENIEKFENIVLEGDRINQKETFEFAKTQNAKVYCFICSIAESLERLSKAGSKIDEKFVLTTRTKSLNNLSYAKSLKLNTETINTGEKHDFW